MESIWHIHFSKNNFLKRKNYKDKETQDEKQLSRED